MSACGFIWCYTILEALVAHKLGYLNDKQVDGMLSLGYILIILPVIGSGLGITVFSWSEFIRRRSIGNGLTAGYNTFAQLYNTYEAIRELPDASRSVLDLFSGRDSDDKDPKSLGGLLVLFLVLLALIAGIFTTWEIVRFADRLHMKRIGQQMDEGMARVKHRHKDEGE